MAQAINVKNCPNLWSEVHKIGRNKYTIPISICKGEGYRAGHQAPWISHY